MISTINFVIFILFVIYIVWTWKTTKEFEGYVTRISYIIIGTVFIGTLTLIFFLFSQIGVNYPKEEMIGEVRNKITLLFTPVNGFIILPQIASLIGQIKNGNISKEEKQKSIRRILIIGIILIIVECIYFKNIQNGIIDLINIKDKG